MTNLPLSEDYVNHALAPLFEAISRRWQQRDQQRLHDLREAAARGTDLPVQGNRALRLSRPEQTRLRDGECRGQEVVGVLAGETPGRPIQRLTPLRVQR